MSASCSSLRLIPLTALFASLAATLTAALAAENSPPNIVLIVADDLGWADVSWHGGPFDTPHLDRLRRGGVELDQHYVSPMCSPTRAALLSGRYASRFGCTGAQNERVLPFGTETLPTALRRAGYDTALVGKWHLGSRPEWGPQHFGFDHSYGSLAGGCGPYDHRYKTGPFSNTWHRDGQPLEEPGHVTDLIAAEAARWIAGRGERPFFLYVAFTAVHVPIKEPQPWLDRYPDVSPPDRRHYAACVSHLDDAVGQVVQALDRAGRRDDTLIMFTSDNGGTQARNDDPRYPADDYPPGHSHGNNLPLRGEKTELYEGGIRVPALAHWPDRLPPGKFSTPIHAVDWMPTLCRLAGCKPAADPRWDGRDIWSWLTGHAPPTPRPLYWAGPDFKTFAVLEGDWKLIRHAEPQRLELFDLARDPHEAIDLAQRNPDQAQQLLAVLNRFRELDNTARP